MVTRAGKDLLRNTIRSTGYHNRLLEEEEMWRHWEMEKGLTMMVADDHLKKRMRMDHYPEPSTESSNNQKSKYNFKQEARRDSHRRKHYWTRKLMEAEEKDPQRWGHSGYKELYPEEFEKNKALKRARSSSSSSRSSSSSSHASRSRSERKRKKSKKRKKKKSKEKSRRGSDSDTQELRREIRTMQKEKRTRNKSPRNADRVRCNNTSGNDHHHRKTRSEHEGNVDSARGRRAAAEMERPAKRTRSRSVGRLSSERKLPRQRHNASRNSVSSSSREASVGKNGSDTGRCLSKRLGKRRRDERSSSHSSVGSQECYNDDNGGDHDDDASSASSSSSSSSSSKSSQSRKGSSGRSSRSSSSGESESSGKEKLLQRQMEQIARFRRHFRSHSLEKEPLWPSTTPVPPAPANEELVYNSEESERNYALRQGSPSRVPTAASGATRHDEGGGETAGGEGIDREDEGEEGGSRPTDKVTNRPHRVPFRGE